MRDTIDWKNKYLELRRRFASSLDLAFRQGYEKGATDTQVSDMQQQMAQNAQMMQGAQAQAAQASPQEAGASEQPGQQNEDQQEAEMQPQESNDQELDQHIAELESLVSKSEDLRKFEELKKSIEKIKNFRTNVQVAKSLKSFGKVSLLPKKIPARAGANLGSQGKNSVALQEKIVNDILTKWESEASGASSEIMRALGTEALTKKED